MDNAVRKWTVRPRSSFAVSGSLLRELQNKPQTAGIKLKGLGQCDSNNRERNVSDQQGLANGGAVSPPARSARGDN
jgi:hypothetical protein